MSKKITPAVFSRRLLTWFDQHGRKDLPWQQQINPYRVWVSEIMLQQTQVSTVIRYFENFMAIFPTTADLAKANIDQVLHLWTGLGYYSRARNLHKSAQMIMTTFSGELPDNLQDMLTLPGIGRSTAGAILAISKQKPHAILDGNVKRVLTRLHAMPGWPGERKVSDALWEIAERYTPKKRPADYTQAIMDLGATLCTRSRPRCEHCPMQTICQGYAQGTPTDFPHKKPKKKLPVKSTVFLMIRNNQQEVLLQRRPDNGIWGGLYCFVQTESIDSIKHHCQRTLGFDLQSINPSDHFRHTFSHYHLDIHPVSIRVANKPSHLENTKDYFWYKLGEINECGLAAPVKKLIEQMQHEVSA